MIDSATQYLGGINFTAAAGSYFIGPAALGGNALNVTNNGVIQILSTLTSTNVTETFRAPIVLVGANNNYTFQNNSANGTGGGTGILSFAGAISGDTAGADVLNLAGSNTNANLISGNISNGNATSLQIVKAGAGAWGLSGANTYTGGTLLNVGTLNINSAGALGTGTLTIGAGTTINNTSGAAINTSTNNNAETWMGNFTFTGSNALNLGTGTVTFGGTAPTVTVTANNLTVGNIAASALGLTKLGAGTLNLGTSNGYTGGTIITAGAIGITTDASLTGGIVPTLFNGGALQFNNYASAFVFDTSAIANLRLGAALGAAANLPAANIIGTGAAGWTFVGPGNLTLTGASGGSSYTGPTNITGGILQFAQQTGFYNYASGTSTWTITNLVVNSGGTAAFNVGGTGEFTTADIASLAALGSATGGFKTGSSIGIDTTNAPGSNVNYNTVLTNPNGGANALGLTVLGSATSSLTLNAANTYTGPTSVNSGTLILGNPLAVQNSVLTPNGGTISFGALTSATAGGLGGAQAFTLPTNFNLTINGGGGATYSGILGGTNLTITKVGTGTQTFSGANTFSGTTVVNAGTLTLTGTQANENLYVVNNGGTLNPNGNNQATNAAFILNNGGTYGGTSALLGTNFIVANTGTSTANNLNATFNALFFGNGNLNWGATTINNAAQGTTAVSIFGNFGGTVFWGGNGNGIRITNGATSTSNPFANFDLGTSTGGLSGKQGSITQVFGGIQSTGTGANIGGGSGSGRNFNIVVGSANLNQTFAGTIQNVAVNASGDQFFKVGTGTLTLTGVDQAINSYNGGFSNVLHGGTLLLDYSLHPTGIMAPTSLLAIGGGTLSLKGNSGASTATTETVASTTLQAGGGGVVINPNGGLSTTLALGALTGQTTTGVSFNINEMTGNAVVSTSTAKLGGTDNTYGGRITFTDASGNTNWATPVSGTSGALTGFSGYTAFISAPVAGSNTVNYRLTDSGTMTASETLNSLKITDSVASAHTLDLSGQTLTLNNGGLLFTGSNAYTIGVTAGDKLNSLSNAATSDLIVSQYGTGNLNIAAVINNGGTGASTLTKAGPGTLTLSAANLYTGATFLNGGTVSISSNSNLGPDATGAALNLSGGTLQATANVGLFNGAAGTNNRAVTIGGAGGTFDVTGSNTLTVAGVVSTLIGSEFGPLIKSNTGTLVLSGINTYAGATIINGGILSTNLLANGNANSGIGSAPSAGAALVLNGGTLQYAGTGSVAASTDRTFTVTSAGGTIDGSGTGAVNFTSPYAIAATTLQAGSGARSLTFTGTTSSNIFAGQIIDGTGGATTLNKTGTGSWILTNTSHSYTGNTNVSGGTLALGTPNTPGSIVSNNPISGSGNIAVTSPGVLDVTGLTGGNFIMGSQKLSGTGSVLGTVTGSAGSVIAPGTVVTNVSQIGTLTTGNLTLSSGTTLNFALSSANLDGSLTANADLISTGTLTLPSSGGVAQFFMPGTTTQFSGNGLYDLVHYTALSGSLNSTTMTVGNANGAFTYTFGTSNNYLTVNIVQTAVSGTWNDGITTPGHNPGNWTDATNWLGGSVPGSGSQGFGDTAVFGSVTSLSEPTVTSVVLNANETVGSVTLNNSSSYTISGSSTLTLNNGTTSAASIHDQTGSHVISAPIALTYGGANPGTGTAFATNVSVDNAVDTLTLSGAISGPAGLTKSGPGTVILGNASNSYGGDTNVNAGVLQFNGVGSLGNGAHVNFAGGTLQYKSGNSDDITLTKAVVLNAGGGTIDTNGNSVAFANAIGSSGTGGFTKTGAGTLTLTAANTYSGNTTVAGGVLNFSTLTNFGTGISSVIGVQSGGTLQWSSSPVDISVRPVLVGIGGGAFDANGNAVAFANSIGNGGTGALTLKTSLPSGSFTYNGASSYTGGTVIDGTANPLSVTINQGGNLGSGTTTFKGTGGSLTSKYTGTNTLNLGAIDVSNGVVATITGSGVTQISTLTNATGNGGTLNVYSTIGAANAGIRQGIQFIGGDVAYHGTINLSSLPSVLDTSVGGTASPGITQTSAYAMFNTPGGFSGDMSSTTFNITNHVRFSANLNSGGNTWTVGALSGDSTVNLAGSDFAGGNGVAGVNNGNATGFTAAVGGLNTNTTFAGTMTDGFGGVLSLTKQGTGIFTITNSSNTYTGLNQINGGTLNLMNSANTLGISGENNSSATGYGILNVNNSGTLAGTGFETDDNSSASTSTAKFPVGTSGNGTSTGAAFAVVTVFSGGHIAPGDAMATLSGRIGTLSIGNLTLNAGSMLDYEMTNTGTPVSDLINVTDTSTGTGTGLTLNGATLNFYQPGTTNPFTVPGTYRLIKASNAGSVALTNFSIGAANSGLINTIYGLDQTSDSGYIDLVITGNPTAYWKVNANGNWGDQPPKWSANAFANGIPTNQVIAGHNTPAVVSFDDQSAAALAATGNTTFSGPHTVALDAGYTIGAMTFNTPQQFTVGASGGTNTLTIDNGVSAGIITVTTGNHIIQAPVINNTAAGVSFKVAAGKTLNVSTGISGTGPVAVADAGTLILGSQSAASGNVIHGATTVSAGTLQLSNVDSLSDSALTVNGTGALAFSPGVAPVTGSSSTTFNVHQITSGNIALNDTAGAGVNLALGGSSTGGSGDATFTYSGSFSGFGSLTKAGTSGTGVVTLTGINSYSGNTIVNNGILAVNAAQQNGGNVIVNNAGTLQINSALGSINGTITLNSGSTLAMGTATVVVGNAVTVAAGATGTLNSSSLNNQYTGFVTSGDVSSVLKVGPNISFGGTSTTEQLAAFAGKVDLTAGSIRWIASTNANGGVNATFELGDGGSMTTRNTGTIDLGVLHGNVTSHLDGGTTTNASATWRIGGGAPNSSFVNEYDGAINDGTGGGIATNVVKSGPGQLVLGNFLVYTGTTTVNNGTLTIANDASSGNLGGFGGLSGTGAVNVGGTTAAFVGSPTLNGKGSVAGPITISGAGALGAAGHIAGGDIGVIGTLNAGSVTFNPGGNLDVTLDSSSASLVNLTGALTLPTGTAGATPGSIVVNLNPLASLTAGTTYKIFSFGSLTNTFDISEFTQGSGVPSGKALSFSEPTSNEIDLTIITGPSNGSSFWTGLTDTNWATAHNWNLDTIPGVTSGSTNSDIATFNGAGNGNTAVVVDSGRNVKSITFDTASAGAYTIGSTGGNALTLSSGGTISVTSTVTNAQTINAPIVLAGGYTVTNNAPTATLTLGGAISSAASGTVTLGGNGTTILSGVNTYGGPTVIGSGTDTAKVTLTSAGKLASASVTVASGATANINGIFTATPAVTVAGTATLGANDTINAATGSLLVRTWGALNVSGNLTVAPVAVASHTSRTVLVTNGLTDTGTINLNNNDLVIHNGSASTVFSELKAGFNAGVGYWNGTSASGSINSNTATASDGKSAATDSRFLTTLGYRNGSAAFTFEAGSSSPMSTAATDVLVKYTYYGDADLNGTLNGSDYQQIDAGFGSQTTGSPLSGWSNGDFNYDGKINGSDFALIDNAMNQLAANPTLTNPLALIAAPASLIAAPADLIAAPAATSAVPEPTTLGLLGLGAMGLLGRRKRRHM